MPRPQIRYGLKLAYHHYLDRAALVGKPALEQMADDLRTMAGSAGCLTKEDLKLLGWTQSQLDLHGEKAGERARSLSSDRVYQ